MYIVIVLWSYINISTCCIIQWLLNVSIFSRKKLSPTTSDLPKNCDGSSVRDDLRPTPPTSCFIYLHSIRNCSGISKIFISLRLDQVFHLFWITFIHTLLLLLLNTSLRDNELRSLSIFPVTMTTISPLFLRCPSSLHWYFYLDLIFGLPDSKSS